MGSSSGGNAAKEAEKQEAARLARVNETTGQINALFDTPERKQQVADFGAAMQDFYLQDLNRQKSDADRSLTFALARSGLTGGSRQIDANRTLGQDYQRGILDAERMAQGAMADLRGQDEQARLNLTSLAQSGLSTGNAATQAAAAMRASLEGAGAAAKADAFGDFFGNVAQVNQNSIAAKDKRDANALYTSMYGPYYQRFSGFSGWFG